MSGWQIVALLGCVIIVYAWIFRKKPDGQDPSAMMAEVEEILDQFVAEITERNDRLIDQLTRLKQEHAEERKGWMARLEQLESRIAELEQRAISAPGKPSDAGEHAPDTIHQRYRELIELKRRGLTEDQIVKQTGMNHGEVKFILQLASREEKRR